MQRRQFFHALSGLSGAALLSAHAPGWAQASSQRAASLADRILILVEFKGGNDGLNTVVPFADPAYAALRPTLALASDSLLKLDHQTGLHPALAPLLPLWEKQQLAVVQSVGYPQPNLSHFRSIEIWETASRSNEYLHDGWATRGLRAAFADRSRFTAEGVLIGGGQGGPLLGARAVSLNNPEAFVSQAQFAQSQQNAASRAEGNPGLQHLMEVQDHINQAAEGLRFSSPAEKFAFSTVFPAGAFGNSIKAAAHIVASQAREGKAGIPVMTLGLGSFDTHQNQLGAHAGLLKQFAEGLAALESALGELNAWDRTLVMTFSEFGRRPRQNNSNGTDHGTAAPHFFAGGAVRGGQLYGQAPDLARLDSAQNIAYSTDFRQLYSTVARQWWGVKPEAVVPGTFETLPFLRS